jgi:Ca2+-binding EF-hand superfamily protein
MIGIVARLGVEDEVERELRRVFEFFSGGEDVMTAQDLRSAMERLGESLKEREINQILGDLDLNSDGYIDFETFLEAMLIE